MSHYFSSSLYISSFFFLYCNIIVYIVCGVLDMENVPSVRGWNEIGLFGEKKYGYTYKVTQANLVHWFCDFVILSDT